MKRTFAILMTLIMLLIACQSFALAAEGFIEMNVGIQQDAGSLDPYGSNNVGRTVILATAYERLFYPAEFGGASIPWMASGYEYLDDTTIQITIYDNIYDAAGNHFTASDVVFCYNNAKELGYSECWTYLDHIEIVDEYTLLFYVTASNISVWDATFHKGVMYTEAAWNASPDGFAFTPVTTARYAMTDFIAGSRYTFDKREDYWGNSLDGSLVHPYAASGADRITYKVIADNSQMAIALETGEIDLANYISSAELPNFYDTETGVSLDGYYVEPMLTHSTYCLQFNASEHSVCAEPLIRKAVSYCVDNQTVVDIALGGLGQACVTFGACNLSTGPDWEQVIANAQAEDSLYNGYNIELARKCLADAGYPDGITLTCMTDNTSVMSKMAQTVQLLCAEAGITIEILTYDSSLFGTYRSTPDTGWDFLCCSWGNAAGQIAVMYNLVYSPTSYGELGTRNFVTAEDDPELQRLREICLGIHATQEDIMAFDRYAHQEMCYNYGIFNMMTYFAAQDGITGIYHTSNVIANGCTFAEDYACHAPSVK